MKFLLIICLLTFAFSQVTKDLRFNQYYGKLSKYQGQVFSNSLSIEYDDKKGFHCISKESFEFELKFMVPPEFLVCNNKVFPFIDRLSDIIYEKVDYKYIKYNIENDFISSAEMKKILLFSYSLNYHLRFNNRTEINKYFKSPLKNKIPIFMKNYIQSFPSSSQNGLYFEDSEYELLKKYSSLKNNYNKILNEILEEIQEHFKKQSDFDYFKFWLIGANKDIKYLFNSILTRGLKIDKRIFDKINPEYTEDLKENAENIERVTDINFSNNQAICLVSFVDFCNFNDISTSQSEKESLINIDYFSDNLLISNRQSLKEGEEYSFVYEKNQNNLKLLLQHGISFKKNINAFDKLFLNTSSIGITTDTFILNIRNTSNLISEIDSRLNTKLLKEFQEAYLCPDCVGLIPFAIDNQGETLNQLRKLLISMNIDESKTDFYIHKLLNDNIEKSLSLQKNEFESNIITTQIPKFDNLLSILQRFKLESRKNEKNSSKNIENKEKIIEFIKNQRMIYSRNIDLNLDSISKRIRGSLKQIKQFYLN